MEALSLVLTVISMVNDNHYCLHENKGATEYKDISLVLLSIVFNKG